ncbi:MAG: helix-turn-helix domain-containing protein [Bacteroidota bacterium]
MTDKKENIIYTALRLFAEEGFNAVSTSRIAKEAKVSEGLIFRHFQNKKGLLDAIVEMTDQKVSMLFGPFLFETDAQKAIHMILSLPFKIDQKEQDFWKLQYKLKWQDEYNNPHKMDPILKKLTWAFGELGYEEPQYEAMFLMKVMDAFAIAILRDGMEDMAKLESFLKKKYKI